jgi:putative ABC transport system substrate-binding protein
MRRRELLTLVGGAVAFPRLAARAQQKAVPVIGYLSGRSLGDTASLMAAFRQGLGEAGFVEGQNVAIEYRWAEGHYDRYPALAADLVGHNVDLIVAGGGTTAALAAKNATATIPIIFFTGVDPVAVGLVSSLARPGGNLTGVNIQLDELTPKRLELLAELVPQARVIALLVNPARASELSPSGMREAARAKGLQLPIVKAATEGGIDAAFATLADRHVDALIVASDPFFAGRREQIVALASRYAVPAIYPDPEFIASGGLISYAPNFTAAVGLTGVYAGEILKGAKPADLPVQRPTAFELIINLKTAKALGITVPQVLLAQADEVSE